MTHDPFYAEPTPTTFEEALALAQESPTLRKLKTRIDQTSLSADMKALLYDIAKITVKVGDVVIAVGRRALDIATTLVSRFPNTALGVVVAVVLTTIVASALSWAPVLALAINKLLIILGLTAGAIEDIRQNAMKEAMERVALQFAPFEGRAQ